MPPREVHVLIADNGHGIPDDALGRIFEPFVTYKENGTGLGLSISKSIVESHRGRIGVRSSVRPGRTGTVFRISLPLEPCHEINPLSRYHRGIQKLPDFGEEDLRSVGRRARSAFQRATFTSDFDEIQKLHSRRSSAQKV